MTKGPREQTDRVVLTDVRARRKVRPMQQDVEQFDRAFVDALRDILHDELHPAG